MDKTTFKYYVCPACCKCLIRLEPFEEGVSDFWCDTCDIDIHVEVNINGKGAKNG